MKQGIIKTEFGFRELLNDYSEFLLPLTIRRLVRERPNWMRFGHPSIRIIDVLHAGTKNRSRTF